MTIEKRGANRYDPLKRTLDIIAGALALVLAAPILIVVSVLVAVKLGRPVLFQQDRPGRGGQVFRLYKFRSMKDVDESRNLISDDERLTPFGRKLRASSLDELPTLWNVLKGDMSFVGPRPLLVKYLDHYTAEQSRRHEVRPGITGLAQVSGRNQLSWNDKFNYDVDYVTRRSLALDSEILLRTVGAVFKREGISAEGHVTMSEFTGDAKGDEG